MANATSSNDDIQLAGDRLTHSVAGYRAPPHSREGLSIEGRRAGLLLAKLPSSFGLYTSRQAVAEAVTTAPPLLVFSSLYNLPL